MTVRCWHIVGRDTNVDLAAADRSQAAWLDMATESVDGSAGTRDFSGGCEMALRPPPQHPISPPSSHRLVWWGSRVVARASKQAIVQ